MHPVVSRLLELSCASMESSTHSHRIPDRRKASLRRKSRACRSRRYTAATARKTASRNRNLNR